MFIKKSHIEELASNLKTNLQTNLIIQNNFKLNKMASENLLDAASLLDEVGFIHEANLLTNLVKKSFDNSMDPSPSIDEMLENLKQTGTVFPLKGSILDETPVNTNIDVGSGFDFEPGSANFDLNNADLKAKVKIEVDDIDVDQEDSDQEDSDQEIDPNVEI